MKNEVLEPPVRQEFQRGKRAGDKASQNCSMSGTPRCREDQARFSLDRSRVLEDLSGSRGEYLYTQVKPTSELRGDGSA